MDSGTIFVIVLAGLFFAAIAYLAVLSRRSSQVEPRQNVTPITPEALTQQDTDTRRRRPAA
jgi:hypothetical protein